MGCSLSRGTSSRLCSPHFKNKISNYMVKSHIPCILHAKPFRSRTLTISLLPHDPWQVGEGVLTSFCHSKQQSVIQNPLYDPFPLKIMMQSCGGECNGAVSIITWYTYKEGARQTCTNRPSVKSSVCVNNSSLHCFNTHVSAHHYTRWFSVPRLGPLRRKALKTLNPNVSLRNITVSQRMSFCKV
jgi:hypothetical protein